MLPRAISIVFTPAFQPNDEDLSLGPLALRLLPAAAGFTAARSSVIIPVSDEACGPATSLPCQCRLLRIGSKVRTFTRQPTNRSKSSGRLNLRSRPGELGLQRVCCAGNQVLHVEQNSKIAAERRAILVRQAGKLLHRERPFQKPPRQTLYTGLSRRFQLRTALGILFEGHAQGAVFRRAGELDVDHFEPVRSCDPLRRRPDCVQTDRHRSYTPSSNHFLLGPLFLRYLQAVDS